jgi:hypothetical protein
LLLRGPNDQNDKKNISRKSKKMPRGLSKSPDKDGEPPSPGKVRKGKKRSLKKGRLNDHDPEEDDLQDKLDQPCYFFLMDKLYIENEIPK